MARWVEHPLTAPSSCLMRAPAALQGWSLPGLGLHLPAQACIPLTLPRLRRCLSTEGIPVLSRGSNDLFIQRVSRCSSTVLEECQGTRLSLCSTPPVHSSDVPPRPLTPPVGCLSWDSTLLDHTTQDNSLLEPASPILHSIISRSRSMVRAACRQEEQEDTMPSHRLQSTAQVGVE